MKDKKIIIIAVVLAALLIGYGWYYQKKNPAPPATISQPESSVGENQEWALGIVVGKQDAPVTIEEYTNFLCPACGNFATYTLPAIQEKYVKNGQVKMVFYILPPLELSQAALCADEQGGFLKYHDYLFKNQSEITSVEALKTMAEKAGLAKETFSQCLDSKKYEKLATSWYEDATKRQVEATPTFYVSGEKLVGAYPFEKFEEVIKGKLPK